MIGTFLGDLLIKPKNKPEHRVLAIYFSHKSHLKREKRGKGKKKCFLMTSLLFILFILLSLIVLIMFKLLCQKSLFTMHTYILLTSLCRLFAKL